MQVKNKYTYKQLLSVQLVLLPKSSKTSKTHQEPKRITQKLKLSRAGEERKGSPAKRGAGSWLSSPTCFGLSQPGERSLCEALCEVLQPLHLTFPPAVVLRPVQNGSIRRTSLLPSPARL